jgi:xanthine/CO dehydrogenase XdhC/CoxF family maturation factor
MSEMKAIVRAAGELRRNGRSFLVATVVRVKGSSYRRPGARMILAEDRWVAGSVSGGFLEGDVLRRGWWRTHEGAPVLVTYDASSDDETRWGLGLEWDGVVDVLLERVGRDVARVDPLAIMDRCHRSQERAAIATIWKSAAPEVRVGARVALTGDGAVVSEGVGEVLRERIAEDARCVIGAGAPLVKMYTTYGSAVDVLVEPIVPPPRLFVFGAGHDVVPVVDIARTVGWDVVVCDPLARWATQERFPQADQVLLATLPEIQRKIDATHRAMAVVMGHNYDEDRAALGMLLASRARYIGVLGPRRRAAQMMADLGLTLGSDDRVHAPVGLEIGSETPHEIALAMTAEVQGVLTQSAATSRPRERQVA